MRPASLGAGLSSTLVPRSSQNPHLLISSSLPMPPRYRGTRQATRSRHAERHWNPMYRASPRFRPRSPVAPPPSPEIIDINASNPPAPGSVLKPYMGGMCPVYAPPTISEAHQDAVGGGVGAAAIYRIHPPITPEDVDMYHFPRMLGSDTVSTNCQRTAAPGANPEHEAYPGFVPTHIPAPQPEWAMLQIIPAIYLHTPPLTPTEGDRPAHAQMSGAIRPPTPPTEAEVLAAQMKGLGLQ